MVDTQHFCLRWNNYQSSITSAFENLRDDEDFVDVTLACDGKSLKAHRVVLSACSPYFRELLKVSLTRRRTSAARARPRRGETFAKNRPDRGRPFRRVRRPDFPESEERERYRARYVAYLWI